MVAQIEHRNQVVAHLDRVRAFAQILAGCSVLRDIEADASVVDRQQEENVMGKENTSLSAATARLNVAGIHT